MAQKKNEMATVAVTSLGCAKNLINSEQMLAALINAGYGIADDPDEADAVVINTCGFIESAKAEAIDAILEAAAKKAEGKTGKIIVTGCLAERYREELPREMPEIDAVLGVGSFMDIVPAIKSALAGEAFAAFGDKNAPVDEAPRIVSTGPNWAYIKIAEGCDNRCAYCSIPDIRGRFRSRPAEKILEEAAELADCGVKELIVVAQDITRYGTDLCGERRLAALVRDLCRIEGLEWIRLHYLYPDEIDDELIRAIAGEPKVVKYLDIPIQHINSAVLKRMNRRGTGDDIRSLLKTLRAEIPGLVLRTSLITGLPGEGEAEFEELCSFLKEARIERAGVFAFSPEEGTGAFGMTDRCGADEAERRAERVMAIQAEVMGEYNLSRVGSVLRVLCEGEEGGYMFGRSFADSPEVDGKVYFEGQARPGDFAEVKITGVMDFDLVGYVL